jgi:hypothetical protein
MLDTMAVRLEAVRFEVSDALGVANFWATLLGREVRTEARGAFVPGDQMQVGLRFVTSQTEPIGRPRLHLHLTSSSLEDQRRTVETALRLGARPLDVGQEPDATHVVLADPGGNELCVIEPGNNYLAGTGYLGEVTCDGSRYAGMFWRDALGWPLVWDQGEQTAIQSPVGGTKIAWDSWGEGPPAVRGTARSRQSFDLVSADSASETDRLVALGATRLADLSDGVEMADPDGNGFALRGY